tara:strand:- start:296 stop:589 length:294 start_codon:yes stop_codon:yes gene_type:complete
MDKKRLRLVVLFAQAALVADVLRRGLDSDKYEILTLDDMCRAEHEQDNIFHLINLHRDEVNIECVIENDDAPRYASKTDKYKMPNAQRQYLQKWQPV